MPCGCVTVVCVVLGIFGQGFVCDGFNRDDPASSRGLD